MLTDLSTVLFDEVEKNIGDEPCLGVAFSGGVDSSLLAKICQKLGRTVTLLTIGFPDSHDIKFSHFIASKMRMDHKIYELKKEDLCKTFKYVQNKIACTNVSHIENCIAFFHIASLAHQNNFRSILTANGCDELFFGYDRYRSVYEQGNRSIIKLMNQKIANEFILMKELEVITTELGVLIKHPFLSRKFITYAKSIPITENIKGSDDLLRKHLLRQVSLSIGVPTESALRPKKALQYGTLIHKNLAKILN
jgi:asparagine synthase (glutamine-hydrolysing)